MASSQIDKDSLEKHLICGICRGVFNEPVTLFCNHTYCNYCIMNLKNGYQGEKKCPLCETKIWQPSRRLVNFVLRDLTKEIVGEKQYQEIYDERQREIMKMDMKDEIVEEIRDEMWRSISDNLHNHHDTGSKKNILNTAAYSPCIEYNHINGCDKGKKCTFKHVADADLLMKHIKGLKNTYGDLILPSNKSYVCADYNNVYGCEYGDTCQYAHIPDVKTLQNEIKRIRKEYNYLFTKKTICPDYNSLQGCSLGDDCFDAHIANTKLLMYELKKLRDMYVLSSVDLGGYFTLLMVILFTVKRFLYT